MKYFALLTIFFSVSCLGFSINSPKKGDRQYGLVLGYQLNFLDQGPGRAQNYTDGDSMRGGLVVEYFFNRWSSLDFSIVGESKQFERRVFIDPALDDDIDTGYISILPLYNFYLFDAPFSLKFGARIGVEVSSDIYDYEPLKFGMIFGGGYYFPLSDDFGLRPEILFDYGISELDENKTFEVHSLIFQLSLFYKGF